ncbi:hypothetical protein M422DRAFT_180705, partial [Sphaerobolus stellatus SS14]
DAPLLARLGYKQEFKRNFSPIEVFGIGFSIVSLLPSLVSVLVFWIPYGGASAMVWGWMTCGIFLTFIALAMAELGSTAPTSGLYYWTFMFSSSKLRCLLSWIVDYSNTIGILASVASVDWGCAVQIMVAASIGSNLNFVPTTRQTFAVFVGLLLCHTIICSLNPTIIARLQTLFIIINILLCLAILIGVPATTPDEFVNHAKYAFGNITNLSGWSPGYVFVLSFLSPLWIIGAFDSTVHISKEATNASVDIPFAIILAAMSSILIGWGLNIALAFCMGNDTANTVNSPIGQPMATILFKSFGQKGTLAVWAFVVLMTCARQIFASSRDGALPFSRISYYISPRTHSPIYCVWFAAFMSLLLRLLAFTGASVIGAVFSLVVAGQYVAYSIPISARFLGGNKIKPGPFSLGMFSLPVAILAVTFMIFITIVFLFPANPNPTAADMNYTLVVLGGVIFFAIVYFYIPKYGGKYWFNGPISTIGNFQTEQISNSYNKDDREESSSENEKLDN